jgi:uncharacterized protein YpmB
MITILLILGGIVSCVTAAIAMLYKLSRSQIEAGEAQARLDRVLKDYEISKKQSEIMAADKSVEDVANDLDRGDF